MCDCDQRVGPERARGGGDLQGLERRRKGVPSAQGRVGDAADLSSDRVASKSTYLCGRPGVVGAEAAGSPARGSGDRLLGGAGDGGATDSTLGDVSHGGSTGASRGQRGLPGRAPGPEGIEADGSEAADTPRGGRNRDVVTIRKIESCPPRGGLRRGTPNMGYSEPTARVRSSTGRQRQASLPGDIRCALDRTVSSGFNKR